MICLTCLHMHLSDLISNKLYITEEKEKKTEHMRRRKGKSPVNFKSSQQKFSEGPSTKLTLKANSRISLHKLFETCPILLLSSGKWVLQSVVVGSYSLRPHAERLMIDMGKGNATIKNASI